MSLNSILHGFLASPRAVALAAIAAVVAPPPPVDLRVWASENMVFGPSDPMPGPYRGENFPMWDRVLEVLSPDDPTTEVTLRGSAQIGKTVVLNIFLGGTFDAAPVDTLIVHPTAETASEWKVSKFDRMRRTIPAVRRVFGADRTRDTGDSARRIETLDGLASLRIANAGSPAALSGTSRPRVILDDLSKFENGPKGDPERLSVSRALAALEAKILRASTPMVRGACRITKAFENGTQEFFEVPCPNCGVMQALAWENMEPNLIENDPASAFFTCTACAAPIEERHRAILVAQGAWDAKNPDARAVSFHIWRVYFPLGRGWGELVDEWFKVKGDPAAEQTFYNDFLGLPYVQATSAPQWEDIRNRTENAPPDEGTDFGVIPARHPLLCAGVDCQGDRLEYTIWAYGRNGKRAAVEKGVINDPITMTEGRSALDRLLKRRWHNQHGNAIAIDRLAIDSGAYTSAVAEWVKKHPARRVIAIKGAKSDLGPIYKQMKFEQNAKSGRMRRARKQWWMLNVSLLKTSFYAALSVTDGLQPNYVHFARGLGDDFYRQITAEHRVSRRSASGAESWVWELVEPGRANEDLDCAVYAEAAARMEGWRNMSEAEWNALEERRDVTPEPSLQGTLFAETVREEARQLVKETEIVAAPPKRRRASDIA